MFKQPNLRLFFSFMVLMGAFLLLISCSGGPSSEQSFEPAMDQSALVSSYASDRVAAESKLDHQYAMQNGLAANPAAVPAAASDLVPAESKLDYRYAVQNGGLETQPSASNEYTLDFWYARQNGYDPAAQ